MFMQVAILLIHVFSNTLLYARADDEGGQLTAASGQNQVDFDRLRHLLETLDYHLRDFQKRTCRLGLHNHHCAFIDLERLKNAGNFLRSAASPGKRSKEMDVGLPEHQITSDEFRAANAVLEDLMEQRQAIATLSRLLAATRADMSNIRSTKRDCRFRLGGHCLTESLDRVASNYYYLKSPNSPGRRRRHLEGNTRMQHEY